MSDYHPDYRIDYYPTHEHKGFTFRPGHCLPFGAAILSKGINFSIFSRYATSCTLVLFERGITDPLVEIPFPDDFKIGDVYSMIVFDLDVERIEYGFRMDGPYNLAEGHRFDKRKVLSDPYSKAIGGRDTWMSCLNRKELYAHRSRLALTDFDWESDRPLSIPAEELIIYEMHVRGFTRHSSSAVKYPGTFAGLREKIPYLKELGVNCVELMPVFEFDECDNDRMNPKTDKRLANYWGYGTIAFFAPKAGYAATGKYGMEVDELKALVKDLHKNGIEVFFDVVFNHTAEGGLMGPVISFKGIDNKTYYMLAADGSYHNFSGTGNTLNCNHPVVRSLVLDCLRYWVAEYHIDGFRFDLASILGRDQSGNALPNPPLLESLALDPVLSKSKLIAEAWDAGGLYQVGSFPAYGRWAEWNGKYRDILRRFLKSDEGLIGEVARCLQGSPDLYYHRGPTAGINFITCHDGFTLRDLFTYGTKHNEANGEDNRDGENANNNWNCGVEGESDDPEVEALRLRQAKNAFTLLMLSQGVPMILMGDEMGRSQQGNNNAYCQDNELTWLDWTLHQKNGELFHFAKGMISFRQEHPVLRNRHFHRHQDYVGSGYPDISFHGVTPWHPDWSPWSRSLAFLLCGEHAGQGTLIDDYVYAAINMYWEALHFGLPSLPQDMHWHVFANTAMAAPDDIHQVGEEPPLDNSQGILVGPRSIMVLVGR